MRDKGRKSDNASIVMGFFGSAGKEVADVTEDVSLN